MRIHLHAAALLLATALGACGGSGSGASGGSGGAGNPPLDPAIYVDAVNGSDATGTGAATAPYKSIRRALTTAGFGSVVRVLPGTYDAANGEVFPLIPGIGTTIIGTERNGATGRQRLSHVVGGAFWAGDTDGRLHATMVPTPDTRLVGLAIHNPQPFVVGGAKPAPVVLASSRVTLESCLLHDSDKGVRIVKGVQNFLITDCDFVRNGIGIFVDGAGAGNRVQRSRVTENGVGVMCFTHGVDFGGGIDAGIGQNVFAGSGARDFVHFAAAGSMYAIGNQWDHAPPTFYPAVADGDVWEGGGSVVTEPSGVYVPPTPFAGTPPAAIPE
jgi:hypothetical protein